MILKLMTVKIKILVGILVFFLLLFFKFPVATASSIDLQTKFRISQTEIKNLSNQLELFSTKIKNIRRDQLKVIYIQLESFRSLLIKFQQQLTEFINTANVEKCLGLDRRYSMINCVEKAARITGDKTLCEIYNRPEFEYLSDSGKRWIEACYIHAAVGKEDSSICEKLETYTKTACLNTYYWKLAVEKIDLSICEKIKEHTTQRECVEDLVAITGNIKWCETLEDEYDRNWCYRDNATTLGECGKASGASRDFCIERLALQNDNVAWCEKIEDEIIKNRCKGKF